MKRYLVAVLLGGVLLSLWWTAKPLQQASATRPGVFVPGTNTQGATSETVVSTVSPARVAVQAQDTNTPPSFTAFQSWAENYLRLPASASEPVGRALAWRRRETMLSLIADEPARALALQVPFAWRQRLPSTVTQYFEEQVDGKGDLEVAMASAAGGPRVYRRVIIGPREFQAFVYGRRLAQASRRNVPLHGIALDGKLALHPDPVRVLQPEEAHARASERHTRSVPVCAVCGQPATSLAALVADTGGELARFCGVEHEELVSAHWTKLESRTKSDPAYLSGSDPWTLGPKMLLYMRVNFPDDLTEPISEGDAYDAVDGANDFYVENSYGLTSITPLVTPLLTLPWPKTSYAEAGPFAVLTDARAAALQAGYDTAFFDLDIVAHTSVPGFDWGGLGMVGGKGTWLQSMSSGVTAHELGHNYGVMHANFWDTSTNGNSAIAQGWNVEYGNNYDTMGAASAGRNHFNPYFKNQLDWLPRTAIATAATNGVYRLYSHDLPHRLNGASYAVRVKKDFERDYWLEFRQQYAANITMANGVMLNWSPWEQSEGGTDLIDTTPGSLVDEQRIDAALVIGRTFSDVPAGVHITPLARGSDGTNAWVDVQVNAGPFADNQAPSLKIEVDIPTPKSGEIVHFHAKAFDPDGDPLAYAWWFDNTSFSTNNLPWTSRSWSGKGTHLVRCVVSDMKGGKASANALVPVGQPTDHVISGKVIDTNGLPVEGVQVSNLADTNSSAKLFSLTDSEGVYLIPGVAVDANLTASQYGCIITNVYWTNPITAGSNKLDADFVAIPLPVVSIGAVTERVPETTSGLGKFLIRRSGDISTNLVIGVHVSGSATIDRDYRLDPPLVTGMNELEFLPGTNTLEIALQAIGDTTAESPETATLMIALRDEYVIGSPGQAGVEIMDDDLQGLSAITIAALNATIPENGTDSGEVVFTRSRSTAGDLYVRYSLTGTAAAGADFVSPAGVVMIPAGKTSASVKFQPIDDKDLEPEETVVVTVLPDAAYTTANASAQLTIRDDDKLTVVIFPSGGPCREPGTGGSFIVKRDGDLTPALPVRYTVSGTASNGTDYTTLSGEVTIPAGAASAVVRVTVFDDKVVEGDETVTLSLLNSAGYDVGMPGSATLVIYDDEKPTVTVTATDDAASEPGDDFASFTISRGSVTQGALPVYLAFAGSAANGVDYIPLDPVVIIPAGASKVSLDVIAFDDLHSEPEETVQVMALPSTNYNVGSSMPATVTIADNDSGAPAIGFTFNSSSAPESKSPGIHLTVSSPAPGPITVNYLVIGGTAAQTDYTLAAGPLTIDSGITNALLPLTIGDNTTVQPDRTIRIALYDPVGATLDGIKIHTYTILDDDSAAVSVSATANGSEDGPAPGNFRISRSGSTNADLSVFYQVAGDAGSPADYAGLGSSVVLPAGAAFVDLPVAVVDDATVETQEAVVVELIRAPGARIVAPSKATVLIDDNDPASLPVISVTATNGPHAAEGGSAGQFTFYRDSAIGTLTLHFAVSGQANPGGDYTALGSSATFQEGQTSVAVPVVPLDDTLSEGEESVVLVLIQTNTYQVLFPGSATVLLHDNEQKVQVDASDFIAAEPGRDMAEFTFTRVGTTNGDLRVEFAIGGTASNGVDFAQLTNFIAIPSGHATIRQAIQPLDDRLVEGPETVTLTLLPRAGYSLAGATNATVRLDDDEPMLALEPRVPSTVEGSQAPGVLTLKRSGDAEYEFVARIAVTGTATSGIDYPALATNVFFPCGITEIDLPVYATNELTLENTETVMASMLPDSAYTLITPSNCVVSIADAGLNSAPVITVDRPAVSPVFLKGPEATMLVRASVMDDGGVEALTNYWTVLSGPGEVAFGSNAPSTTVGFTNEGTYAIRLTAYDGQLQTYHDFEVTVLGTNLFADANLHWPLDDGSGTNVTDISGSGRAGSIVGDVSWATQGILAGAIEFGESSGVIVTTNAESLFNRRRELSVSLWFNPADSNLDQSIFSANTRSTNGTLGLSCRRFASCGQGTNVYEISLFTGEEAVHYVSQSWAVRTGWHNLILTWAGGSGIVFYVDGVQDRPGARAERAGASLENCPEFVLGGGTLGQAFPLRGQVDDVMIFGRALTGAEVAAIAFGVSTNGVPHPQNLGPIVDAGTNLTVQLPIAVALAGSVWDDGLPDPPATVSNVWELVEGPAPVEIPYPHSLTNSFLFAQTGTNVFRLIADDGQIATCDEVTVLVVEPTQVDIYASDSSGAELGPDPGEFTISRGGDADYDMTVYLEFSGIATNGVDFAPITNVVMLPVGTNSTTLTVIPYLDHRTEGDQDLTITIVSNAAYTVGSGQATVLIQDSPYGKWTIENFTLEELTIPPLSGERADFDEDGVINFIEYAFDQNPKVIATNPPVQVRLESGTDGKQHAMLTFQRRLQPTDVEYTPVMSEDLVTWNAGPDYIEEVSVVDDGNYLTETVTMRVLKPLSPEVNQFVTVRCRLLTTEP